MERISTNYTVSDYCAGMERGEIVVNKEYQRSERVWPDIARSFLIETMLLGFPMPKLYLYSVVDLKKRKTVKEIVDGQQRSMAIWEFFEDKFMLSRKLETEDFCGKKFSELDDEWQQKFITYAISADLFVSATDEEVRETFRRMNSYTIPLNPEEQRHAEFQGAFKWFVNRIFASLLALLFPLTFANRLSNTPANLFRSEPAPHTKSLRTQRAARSQIAAITDFISKA